MAEEKTTNQDQAKSEDRAKSLGVGAGANYQGQQRQPDAGRNATPNETAGQGGGIQGTGQHQANPGGLTEGQGNLRDEGRDDDNPSKQTDQGKPTE